MKTIIILALIAMITGCADTPYNRWKDEREQQKLDDLAAQANQKPSVTAYQKGMQDGYSSGNNATNGYKPFKKDIDAYVTDAYYKSGWDDGFNKGKLEGENINAIIRDSVR